MFGIEGEAFLPLKLRTSATCFEDERIGATKHFHVTFRLILIRETNFNVKLQTTTHILTMFSQPIIVSFLVTYMAVSVESTLTSSELDEFRANGAIIEDFDEDFYYFFHSGET